MKHTLYILAVLGALALLPACNIDEVLEDEELIIDPVEPAMSAEVSFPTPSYFQASTTRYTFAGRPVHLTPILAEGVEGKSFEWAVDGVRNSCTSSSYIFTPSQSGTYHITACVDGLYATTVEVVCVRGTEASGRRGNEGSPYARVLEWTPAPGQFINEGSDAPTTFAEAVAWAQKRIDEELFVSLGAFGGYIIMGFDHSVPAGADGYDFAVLGNAFTNAAGGSNEPGIVYVMQDVNGNGLPDDEWYELSGSESDKAATRLDYAVSYTRPAGAASNVAWTDNAGGKGEVLHMGSLHPHDCYYPAWISADSYTLRGTCLATNNIEDISTGLWTNKAFEWGYADNLGTDKIEVSGHAPRNGFRITNATQPDGTPIALQYIDFVKVQTGVLAQSGWLGEVSTEVCGVIEY